MLGFEIPLFRSAEKPVETASNLRKGRQRQDYASCRCASPLARAERYIFENSFWNKRCLLIWNVFTGSTTAAGKIREIFSKQGCLRKAINQAFSLSDVYSKIILLDVAWINFKSFNSGLYEADTVETKVCLELSCSADEMCRCSECICCYGCTGECGCLATSRDFDFILQQLLIDQPCFSYK